MQYKKKSTGKVLEVLDTDKTKQRILERSGWLRVPATVTPDPPPTPTPLIASVSSVVDDLPANFPEREALTQAGYGALLLVRMASDDELLAIEGIGKAKLKDIRAFV